MPDVEGGKSVEFSPRLVHGGSDPGEAHRPQTSNCSNAGRSLRPTGCSREGGFTMKRLSLVFSQPSVEGEYLCQVARSRWPVLMFIFAFDVACYFFRFLVKLMRATDGAEKI
ncbi:hypothetical protein DUNSADRAFT_14565 [Dunaliella salina]|uniref:Encoded protein n=1 Tax=Dunaliella salina TaxID=3046 RepID=A0ABQ7G764_DUNSA|nr:hypothetical protein DUNSADRAFT_14565 [Dunaliella salina]|eukprot:KAF5830447.1 hypothetical protein DUNSADRAFT_14565 [Dunaliella salina]